MSRVNKKTRIKGTPVKVRLQNFENTTGSLPTTARFASDNRTGIFPLQPFDDRITINFGLNIASPMSEINAFYNFNSASGLFDGKNAEITAFSVDGAENNFIVNPTAFFKNRLGIRKNDLILSYSGSTPISSSNVSSSFFSKENIGLSIPWLEPLPKPQTFLDTNIADPLIKTRNIENDRNLTAIQFTKFEPRVLSGSAESLLNLSKVPSGKIDKPWSISFWIRLNLIYENLGYERFNPPSGKTYRDKPNVTASLNDGGPYYSNSFDNLRQFSKGIVFSVAKSDGTVSGNAVTDMDYSGSLIRVEYICEEPIVADNQFAVGFAIYIGDTGNSLNFSNDDIKYLYLAPIRPTNSSGSEWLFDYKTAFTDFLKFGRKQFIPSSLTEGRFEFIRRYPDWAHITITYDGSGSPDGIRLYQNGEIVKDMIGGVGGAGSGSYAGISSSQDTIFTFNGFNGIPTNADLGQPDVFGCGLDQLCFFDKELGQSEVRELLKTRTNPTIYSDLNFLNTFLFGSSISSNNLFFDRDNEFCKMPILNNNIETKIQSSVIDAQVSRLEVVNEQELLAFEENSLFASDGKSIGNDFYSGNEDFEVLNSSYWDKTTIQFKLNNTRTVYLDDASSSFKEFNPTTTSGEDTQFLGTWYMNENGNPETSFSSADLPGGGNRPVYRGQMAFFDFEQNFWKTSFYSGRFSPILSRSFASLSFDTVGLPALQNLVSKNKFLRRNSTLTALYEIEDVFSYKKLGFLNSCQSGIFLPNLNTNDDSFLRNMRKYSGTPTNLFGFPFADKYQDINRTIFARNNIGQDVAPGITVNPNQNTALNISDKIPFPFLLEKVVIDFSASFNIPSIIWTTSSLDINGNSTMVTMPYAINTFFILNQIKGSPSRRRNISIKDLTNNFNSINIDFSGSKETTHLVTYLQHLTVATASNDAPFFFNDYAEGKEFVKVLEPSNVSAKWSERIVMSGTIKSPEKLLGNGLWSFLSGVADIDGDWSEFLQNYPGGGRTSFEEPVSRNFRTPFGAFTQEGSLNISGSHLNNRIDVNNPYLILPGDKLIFGWQSPVFNNLQTYEKALNIAATSSYFDIQIAGGPQLVLPPGVTTVTLYGSQLRNGEQFHDTLNQNLTSISIREAIGD
jgi:hypothetical protein